MASIGYATLQVIPSLKGFNQKLRLGMSGPLATTGRDAGDKAGRSAGSAFGGAFSKVALAATAAVGVAAIGKGFYDAAIESQKVTKQTEAVLKSMGNVAGVTADDVAKLSERLSMQSGVDDELIQSSQNVLLTFGKVQNQVGKGNAIFDRASQSALDMSVALGTDLQGATLQVGKALNDPIKGMTALTRAGVSFTEQQKEQVKQLVATGDTLGAQKVILAELENQFAGSAAAQATAGDRLKVVWGNLQETLGGYLVPAVEAVASVLADKLPGAMAAGSRAVRPLIDGAKQLIGVLFEGDFKGGPFSEDSKVVDVFFRIRDAVVQVVQAVRAKWPEIQRIVALVMDAVRTVIVGAVAVMTTLWNNFGDNILAYAKRVWPNIQQIIQGALDFIAGLVKLITAVIRGDWSAAWDAVKQTVSGAWNAIQGLVKNALEALRLAVGAAMEVIGSAIKAAWNGIVDFIGGLPARIAQYGQAMWDGLLTGLDAVLRIIGEGLERLVNMIISAVNAVIDAADRLAGPLVNFGEVGKADVDFRLPGRGGGKKPPKRPWGGWKAHGGPVKAGFMYGINEVGQEFFVPRTDGTVIPANRAVMAGVAGPPQTIYLVVDGKVLAQAVAKQNRVDRGFRRAG
jgi:hypothetical protein